MCEHNRVAHALVNTCASLYCSYDKQIRKELEQQAKVTLSTGNRTLPQRDKEKGNNKKMTKPRLGLMPSEDQWSVV